MTETDELLANNRAHVESHGLAALPVAPRRRTTVVACMDSRLDVFAALGLGNGEVHVIRNAGGLVTDDVIRSLAISQRLLGTREVILIHHTDCGLLKITDDEFAAAIEADTGASPSWRAGAFSDLDAAVRVAIARIRESPFIPFKESVRGFVYDVATGELREVS